MKIQNILCDRDGTLIMDKHYLSNPMEVELLPSVKEGIALLQQHQYFLAVISNQSGIGRGYFTKEDVDICNSAMCSLITPHKICFNAILYCPHSPYESCLCRKPSLGMWYELQHQYHLQADHTIMIGDKKEDICFAINAHFPYAFLVLTGKGYDTLLSIGIIPTTHCFAITDSFAQYYNIDTRNTTIYAVTSYIDAINYVLTL